MTHKQENPLGTQEEKKRQLYNRQKEMLRLFLQRGAISKSQYEKSLGDLTQKMGYQILGGTNMQKKLVAYFSASSVTADVAKKLAGGLGADLYEIKPEVKYTKEDLDWTNLQSRSSVEMNNKSFRPAIVTGDVDVSGYDTVYLGFPIWWYVAPTLIHTFLEAYDFGGKKIVLFATSGGSGFGKTAAELQSSAPKAQFTEAMVISGAPTEEKIKALTDCCSSI